MPADAGNDVWRTSSLYSQGTTSMESCASSKNFSADRRASYSARLRRHSREVRTSVEIQGDSRSSMDSSTGADDTGNILSIDIAVSDDVRKWHLEPRTLETTSIMDLVHNPLWLWCSSKKALVWANTSARMLDTTQTKSIDAGTECTDEGKVSFVEMRLRAVEDGECIVFLQGAAMRLFPMPTAAVDGDEIVEVVAKPYRFKASDGTVTPCCLLEVIERLSPDTARDLEMLYEAPTKTLLFDTSGKLLTKGRHLGSSMSELFTSEGEDFLRDMVQRLFHEGENHIFSHHEVGDRWLSLNMQASRDPVTYNPAILVNINDITDMKRAEVELMRENVTMAEQGRDLQAENTRLQERLVTTYPSSARRRRLSLNTETPADLVHDLLSRLASGRRVSISVAQAAQQILWDCDGDIHTPIDLNQRMSEGEDAGMSIAQMVNAPQVHVTDALSKKWRRDSLDAGLPDVTHRAIHLTGGWDFDSFAFSEATRGRPLSTLGAWIFEKEGLVTQYNLDMRKLSKFLRGVEDGYPDNPYHSRMHATAVLHMTYMLISQGGVMKTAFEPETVMCCYLAAIMHDYKHPGLDTEHLVKRRSSLALRYNDRSPLENHHISSAWRLLLRPECNFLDHVSDDVYRGIRDMTIDLVLSTDMQHHFNIVSRFKRSALSQGAESTNSSVEMLEDSTSRLVQQMIVKVADLSHVAAPTGAHRKWVSLLQEEHWRQGDVERELGMSVSHMMNRHGGGITDSQMGFFEIIVMPTFEVFSSCFEGARTLYHRVQCNYEYWLRAAKNGQSGKSSCLDHQEGRKDKK